jgi:hypothetical protein
LNQIGTAADYDELQAIMRARAETLNISRQWIDHISGLPAGFAGKILSLAPVKRLGPDTIGPMLAVLALKLIVVEDPDALLKYSARANQRDEKQAKNANASDRSIKRIRKSVLRDLTTNARAARNRSLSPRHRKRISQIAGRARWKKRRAIRRRHTVRCGL